MMPVRVYLKPLNARPVICRKCSQKNRPETDREHFALAIHCIKRKSCLERKAAFFIEQKRKTSKIFVVHQS
ncbi:hypothetical protein EVA_08427 [gut metagenome]|uniref:Uncharacterized protein n=1 Tax=gut metagenome TaxID=749906 RepID=J9G9C3_9ZZZZ